MITEYHRPETMGEALRLLERSELLTLPLGGGTLLNQPSPESIAVVDLQGLGLNQVAARGNLLEIGATVTLQQLLGVSALQIDLAKAIRHEATYNLRQVATAAGTLASGGGRSPMVTALLALDASLQIMSTSGIEEIALGDVLPVRSEKLKGKIITRIMIPSHARLAYEYVARTPADLPIVCVAVAQWPSGRSRAAVGGYGRIPLLAFDGPESQGLDVVAAAAYSQAQDEWASAVYRQEMAATLARRCLSALVAG